MPVCSVARAAPGRALAGRRAKDTAMDMNLTGSIQPTRQTGASKSGFRWVVVALAFLITIISYLDRSAISYAIGPLQKEFGLSYEDFGFIAAAFGVGYMVMTVGGGILVDRWGARKVWAGAAVVWSAVTGLTGAANGFWMLCLLRTMLGLAEGPSFPALSRTVSDWLPLSERARASAIGLSAVPLASVVGAPLISQLIAGCGWKATFVILASLGLIWAVVWYRVFRDYPENSPFVRAQELQWIREGLPLRAGLSGDEEPTGAHLRSGRTTWRFMLFHPALASNNFAFFAFGYLLFFALSWLPGYLEKTYDLHLKTVGIFLIAPWLTAAILLTLAGCLSDWLWLKTGSARIARSHMIWICQLLSAACILPLAFIHSLPAAITLISLGVGLGLMPNAAFYALNADLARDRVGTSLGVMDCFFAASGVVAPALTGWLVQVTGNFNAAFLLLGALTVSSVAGIILFQHPDAEIKARYSSGLS